MNGSIIAKSLLAIAFLAFTPLPFLHGQDKAKSDSPPAAELKTQEATSDDKRSDPISFNVADGRLEMKAPGDWKKVDPAVNLIEAEFSIEPIEGETKASRLTVMGAGGSIDANIERWLGQVQQPDGGSTRDKATITEKDLGEYKIHILDVSGTYIDQRGPQAPKVELKDHRLLAVIIETGSVGNYFVKLYGPEKTIAKHKDAFVKMVEELKFVE
jgi:hypothetical protein